MRIVWDIAFIETQSHSEIFKSAIFTIFRCTRLILTTNESTRAFEVRVTLGVPKATEILIFLTDKAFLHVSPKIFKT